MMILNIWRMLLIFILLIILILIIILINIIIIITWQQNLTGVMVKVSMDISQWFCSNWVLTLIIYRFIF